MRHRIAVLSLSSALFVTPAMATPALSETPPERNRMVHQRGTEIVDGGNRPLKLRGVNLGNWYVWAPYAWGGPLSYGVSTSVMKGRMRELVGEAETERFLQEYEANYIREVDIARIGSLGFNVVRMPMHWEILEDESRPFVYKQSGWRVLDSLLSWAEKHRVYVVIDLHAAPGGQSGLYTSDPDRRDQLWDSRIKQDRAVALWRAIAQRYRDRSIVAGYDLINEPGLRRNRELVELYRRLVAAIREVDPDHMIILENARLADFADFEPLSRNKAYSPHIYTWFKEGEKYLKKHADVAQRHRVPLWIGEFGEERLEKVRSNLELFESGHYPVQGWAFWSWKKVPKNETHLMGIRAGQRWLDLVQVIGGRRMPRKRPSREQTLAAMREFTEAVRLENNMENAGMRELLISFVREPGRRPGR